MSITAWQASSWSRATITPFPAARPLAFTTRAGKSALENQRDEINLDNVQQESFLCLPAAATDIHWTDADTEHKMFFFVHHLTFAVRAAVGEWVCDPYGWRLSEYGSCCSAQDALHDQRNGSHWAQDIFFPLLPSPLSIKVTNLFMPDCSVRLRSSERRSLHLRSLTHETIWGRKLPSSFTVSLFMRFTALKTKLRSHRQSFTINRKPHLQSQLLLQLSWTKTSFQQSKTRTVTLMKCIASHILL